MLDFTKYTQVPDEIQFLQDIYNDCKNGGVMIELYTSRDDYIIIIPADNNIIRAYINEDDEYIYNSVDELFLNFKLYGKPFIESAGEFLVEVEE